MRILLIHPSTPAYGGKEDFRTFYPPLGLACIAAPLTNAGHEVRILDMGIESLSQTDVLAAVRSFSPDVAGFRCQFINYPRGLALAEMVKQAAPSCKIIFGGPHMGLVAEEAINDHAFVDAVVHGEGEITLLEYIDALDKEADLNAIKGLIWKGRDGAVRNEFRPTQRQDMAQFPAPAIELLPMHLYKMMNFFSLEGHRGCPMRCTFCSLPKVQTNLVRYKPPEHLVREMEQLVYDFGINRFELLEVNFTIKKSWAHEVSNLIIKKKLPVQWICRSYPELVDKPTLALMRKAGCYRIYYGIESGSAEILKNYRKITTVEQGKQAIKISQEVGLEVYCDFLIGGPGENAETVAETIRFAKETSPDYSDVSLIVPFPGTPMYDQAGELGVKVLEPKWYENPETVSQFPYVRVMELDTLSKKELESLWVHAATQILHGVEI